jgi:hypothetical protein
MSGSEDVTKLTKENERLRAKVNARTSSGIPGGPTRIRGIVAAILVVLTSVCIVATTAGVWIHRTIWNTDRYVDLVAPLANDPAVTDALAVELTQDTFQALNVQARVQQALAAIKALPDGADALLAGPLTAAAENLVGTKVKEFLASDSFLALWVGLNERVHEQVVALLNGDADQLPNVAINDGQVQLNMITVISEILQRVAQEGIDTLGLNVTVPDIPPDLASPEAIGRLGSALGVTLPADFGQITIMSEGQLSDYQQTAQNLKRLSGVLFVVSCLLVVITIAVSPTRRRTLIWLGVGVALGLFLGGVLIRRLEARLLDAITDPRGEAAARNVFAEVASGLRGVGLMVLVVAALVALVAYLAGRPPFVHRMAARGRALAAARPQGSELEVWLTSHADAVRIGGAIVAAVVLFFAGIGWIPVGIVVALCGALLWGVSDSIKRTGRTRAS